MTPARRPVSPAEGSAPFGGASHPLRSQLRRLAAVRTIGAEWRRLTGGTGRGRDERRRTLIACSGGGDSSGLVLALWAAAAEPGATLVVGHVVHDLRSAAEALADRDAARELALRLGLAFAEASVAVLRKPGNAEANARAARYEALTTLALEHRCRWVATAHHERDQLESVVMGLVRGAGPRGLAAVAPSRSLGGLGSAPVRLIRPALSVSPVALAEVCQRVGWTPAVDVTNADVARLRAALRHGVVPALERLRPAVARRAARAAELQRSAAGVIEGLAREVLDQGRTPTGAAWPRAALQRHALVVLAELPRVLARESGGRRPSQAVAVALARAIRSRGTDPKEFRCGAWCFRITAHDVIAEPDTSRPASASKTSA